MEQGSVSHSPTTPSQSSLSTRDEYYSGDCARSAMATHTILPLSGHSPPAQSVIVPNSAVFFQSYSPPQEGIAASVSHSSVEELHVPCELSPPSSTGASSPIPCQICGDKATGKHYGAHSCDGCKGFFRRSVRKVYNYSCRFKRNCIVDKDKRNQCRFCRFKKCFHAGMRKEAVQNERDKISQHRYNFEESSNNENITIKDLVNAGQKEEPGAGALEQLTSKEVANVDAVCSSMKQQIIILVEWVKRIPAFTKLKIDDQIALLRGHTAEQLVLGAAWRSIPYDNIIILGNKCIIPRFPKESLITKLGCRIMDEVVQAFKELTVDDTEYFCMKALVFFDQTGVKNLSQIEAVKAVRTQVLYMLEDYVNERHLECRGRFGRLLLLLPVLGHIAWKMVEFIQYEEVIGNTNLDSLLKEMLLGDTRDSDGPESITTLPRDTKSYCTLPSPPDYMMDASPPMVQMNQINSSEDLSPRLVDVTTFTHYEGPFVKKEIDSMSVNCQSHFVRRFFKQEVTDNNHDVP